jgi:hypothetical protein
MTTSVIKTERIKLLMTTLLIKQEDLELSVTRKSEQHLTWQATKGWCINYDASSERRT